MDNKENKEDENSTTASNNSGPNQPLTSASFNEIPTQSTDDSAKDGDGIIINDLEIQANLQNMCDTDGNPREGQTVFRPAFPYIYKTFRDWIDKECDKFLAKHIAKEPDLVMPSEEEVKKVRDILIEAGQKINESLSLELEENKKDALKNENMQLVAGSSKYQSDTASLPILDDASNKAVEGIVSKHYTPENKSDLKMKETPDPKLVQSSFVFANTVYRISHPANQDVSHSYGRNIIIGRSADETGTGGTVDETAEEPADDTGNEAAAMVDVPLNLIENEEFGELQSGYFSMVTITRPTKLGEELTYLIHHDEKIQTLSDQNSTIGDSIIDIGDMWWYGLHIYLNNLQGEFSNQRYGKVYIKYVTLPNNPASGFIDEVIHGKIKTYSGPLSDAPTNRVMNNIRLSKHEFCEKNDITSSINFADFEYEDFDVDTSEIDNSTFPEVLDTFKDVYPSQTFDLVVYQFRITHTPRPGAELETTTASVSSVDMEDSSVYFTPPMVICKKCWQIMDDGAHRQ